jgi:hypothetical protein
MSGIGRYHKNSNCPKNKFLKKDILFFCPEKKKKKEKKKKNKNSIF